MARSRNNNGSNRTPVRDTFVVIRSPVPSALSLLEDRRRFDPLGELSAPRAFFKRPRLVVRNANLRQKFDKFSVPSAVGFDVPKNVAICVRRKERREVIHAKRLTRRGGHGAKRRNWWSDVRC